MTKDIHQTPGINRRVFLARLLSLASAPLLLAGCARSQPLSVGIHPWIGYETLFLAQDFGWLPSGVNLQKNNDAGASLAALRAGQIDAATLTLDEVLKARADGIPLTVVLVFDISAGADMILARPGIDSLKKLAGKRIGAERSALGALMLAKTLEAAGLTEKEVTLLDLPPDRQLDAWRQGAVDAVATYGRVAAHLKREGALLLIDSRQMPDAIFDVLAVRRDRIAGRESLLSTLLAAHFRGLAHLRSHRQDALYRISAHQDVQPAEAQQALAGIELPTLAGNLQYLRQGSRFAQAAADINRLMLQHGLISQPDSLVDLYDAAYLPRADQGGS